MPDSLQACIHVPGQATRILSILANPEGHGVARGGWQRLCRETVQKYSTALDIIRFADSCSHEMEEGATDEEIQEPRQGGGNKPL